ncbi:MAG TPA: exopolysaccharide biosynthesis protein [Hyphomonadaceae bacterium]
MSAGTDVRSGGGTGAGTSALLLQAVRGDGERVTVGQILDALDARAFGLATLIFSLPSVVPMPPGVPTVVGIALLIVSLQMVIGRQELWLPGFLTKRSFSRVALVRAFEKLAPRLEAVEKIAKPRLLFMTGRIGTVAIGLVVLFMAVVLILPLPPGGNFPPALACAILGMGLAERDGIIVLFGLVVSVAATFAVSVVTVLFIQSFPDFLNWLGNSLGF